MAALKLVARKVLVVAKFHPVNCFLSGLVKGGGG